MQTAGYRHTDGDCEEHQAASAPSQERGSQDQLLGRRARAGHLTLKGMRTLTAVGVQGGSFRPEQRGREEGAGCVQAQTSNLSVKMGKKHLKKTLPNW